MLSMHSAKLEWKQSCNYCLYDTWLYCMQDAFLLNIKWFQGKNSRELVKSNTHRAHK